MWCDCEKGLDSQHAYPEADVTSYEAMLEYIEDEVGCKMKSFEKMCALAHYSPGVARGGRFSAFTCPCCGHCPSERKWRADLAAFQKLSEAEQKEHRAEHNEQGIWGFASLTIALALAHLASLLLQVLMC